MTISPPIPEKFLKRTQRDIEFIIRQIIRFSKMQFAEQKAYLEKHPMDASYQIPHPNGQGSLQCGGLAWSKFGSIADLVLDLDQSLGRRVRRQGARDAVTEAFVRRVLEEEREINRQTSELILNDALVSLRQSVGVAEHYFPCVLFPEGEPDTFSIGPVTFTRRRKFFKDKKANFKQSIEANTVAHIEHVSNAIARGFPRDRAITEGGSRELVRDLQARSIRTYREYPWVASVKVTDCDSETSQERATQSVEMAIHVLRVMLGASATKKVRLAWSESNPLHTAHLYADERGVIHPSIGMNTSAPVGTANWHDALMRGPLELDVLGSALNALVDPVEIPHLHQRLLDAINWFGDAATDSNTSSGLVKYVSAIERLFLGKSEQGQAKRFARRAKTVLEAFDCDQAEG
ncbi:hypothetical protein [Salinisphaera sp. Q1T1-3]|uniref:hypothetical protein n=1 Tax=Salinisphaera sp. Q1T1-3 TaxID=2321229 RepID=UPI001F3BE8C1|nr:hypothetical protein [Salinisphaera sp. Q1T1-3]